MLPDQSEWKQWERFLHQYHLIGISRFLFDAGAPIKILVSQSLYLLAPLFHKSQFENFAKILEDDEKSHQFLNFLENDRENG